MITNPNVIVLLLATTLSIAGEATPIAARAFEVLCKGCGHCHGDVNPVAGLSVLDHASLIDTTSVVPGNLEESELWRRVTSEDEDVRVPRDEPLTAREKETLRLWIAREIARRSQGRYGRVTRAAASFEDGQAKPGATREPYFALFMTVRSVVNRVVQFGD